MNEALEAVVPQAMSPMKSPITPLPSQSQFNIEAKRHLLSELGKAPIQRKPGKYFRILSIDGGGVRGIIPSIVIKYIEERTGKKIHELFNLVSGTSTGALLGAVLLVPDESKPDKPTPKFSSKDTLGLYMNECPKIFQTDIFHKIQNLWGLTSARYPAKVKRRVLKQYAGEFRITDCLTDVLIPSFDMRAGEPYIFKSTMAREGHKYNYRLVDVLDATSAAPTYFKPRKVQGHDADHKLGYRCFIDGAVTANCPALCSVVEAIKVYKEEPENIIVVSLGCGDAEIGVTYKRASGMGALGWATYIPNALIAGSIYSVEQQADQILDDKNYWRFQTRVPANHSSIDDASNQNLLWLKKEGMALVKREKARLDKLCDLLVEGL